ncbi:hypothetical protein F6R98_18895 [Candidatus Methylospira mobilis]|uniref:Uncharacterized protein n=1 Tax=Candidatus Methylospira mobilis TaxID=1808979 RepID=A0A5Q0BQG6_9GAMM|nr:hypothetical protein F6R98_18895 [Candidatus Methylospira mobilis]
MEREGSTIVFHRVPAADVRENCGEVHHSANITKVLLQQAETSIAQGVEVDVRCAAFCSGSLIIDSESFCRRQRP